MISSTTFVEIMGQPYLHEIECTFYIAHERVFGLLMDQWNDDLCESLLDLVLAIQHVECIKSVRYYN